jgi:PAS domain-containing protein
MRKKTSKSSEFENPKETGEGDDRYRILIENTHDIVYSLDAEGNFTYLSP